MHGHSAAAARRRRRLVLRKQLSPRKSGRVASRNDTPHIKHPHPRPRARDDRRFHAYGCLFFQLVFVRCTKKQGIHGRFGERACLLFILQAKPFILGGPRLFSCSGDANGPICDATMVHQDGFRYQVPLSNRLINVVLV